MAAFPLLTTFFILCDTQQRFAQSNLISWVSSCVGFTRGGAVLNSLSNLNVNTFTYKNASYLDSVTQGT